MDINKLIGMLENIALALEIMGESPFKSRAYRFAAEAIRTGSVDVEAAVAEGRLGEIKGFGKALEHKITEYATTCTMQYYERLFAEIPESLLEITRIGGIGPKKAGEIYRKLGIATLEQLEQSCLDGSLARLKGFGVKSQEIIFNGIQHRKASRGRYLQQQAVDEAAALLLHILRCPAALRCEVSGSIRRRSEIVDELCIVVATARYKELLDYIGSIMVYSVEPDISTENSIIRSVPASGIPIKIIVVGQDQFIIALHETTGSEPYIEEFNRYAAGQGFQLSDYRLMKDGLAQVLNEEEDLFSLLSLQFVPSELRERASIIHIARNHELPQLVAPADLKGMIHVHSNWSDGEDTVLRMALESKRLGFSYVAICDHSRTAAYAGGLKPEDVRRQHEEIDRLNSESLGIRILKGIESDILSDGSLDYDVDLLESFDIVVASVHSSFNMSRRQMTARMVSALKSDYTTILGHPTGRLLLARPAYELDIYEVIDAAADYGKIIELNANPYRLDLPWEYLGYAKQKGVKISINPDSHSAATLVDVFAGVDAARKGCLEPSDIVNCLEYDGFINL